MNIYLDSRNFADSPFPLNKTYIYIYIYILCIYIYIFIHTILPVCITRFASQRTQPFGKSYGITYQKRVPGPPNPWNKYCAVNSCDPTWE